MATDVDLVREAIRGIVQDEEHQQVMVGDLLLIAEVIGPDGENELLTLHNLEITRWKELGFLHDRIASISEGHFELGLSDIEED